MGLTLFPWSGGDELGREGSGRSPHFRKNLSPRSTCMKHEGSASTGLGGRCRLRSEPASREAEDGGLRPPSSLHVSRVAFQPALPPQRRLIGCPPPMDHFWSNEPATPCRASLIPADLGRAASMTPTNRLLPNEKITPTWAAGGSDFRLIASERLLTCHRASHGAPGARFYPARRW